MACPVLTKATQQRHNAFCPQKALCERAQCLLTSTEVISGYRVVKFSDLKSQECRIGKRLVEATVGALIKAPLQ